MKKNTIFCITILLLCVFINGEDQETLEFIDTDIFCRDLKLASKSLTVHGISLDMPILDVLTKFGKSISDINFSGKYFGQMLLIEPGLEIITDKVTVKSIIITQDFKYLKGKNKDFFDLKTGIKALYFLFINLGEPIGLKSKEPFLGGEEYEVIYSNGISFTFLYAKFDKQPTITINILSKLPELPNYKNVESTNSQNSNINTNSFHKGKTVAVQCRGYTKKGKRCENMTTDSSGYCHEHR